LIKFIKKLFVDEKPRAMFNDKYALWSTNMFKVPHNQPQENKKS